jgi:dipeptidyl aminopeptidase/acylaminoacyl peptidase
MTKKITTTVQKAFILTATAALLLILNSCQSKTKEENKQTQIEMPAPLLDMKSFFKNGNKTSVLISPDGNYFSFRADYKGMMNIFVRKATDTIALRVTNDTLRSIGSYFWKGDRIVYGQDIAGDENYQLFSVKADGSEFKALTPFSGIHTNVIDALTEIPNKEKNIIVGINKRVRDCDDPYFLNIETGELKLLYKNNENYDTWVTDNAGFIRFASKPDGINTSLVYRKNDNEKFTPLVTIPFEDQFTVCSFDKDNKNMYVLSNIGRDKVTLIEYDPSIKKEVKELYSNKDYDLEKIFYDRKMKALVSVTWTGEKKETHFFDSQWAKIQQGLDKKFEGYKAIIIGYDEARTKAITLIYNDRMWPKFYLYNFNTKEITEAANPYPWCNEKQMSHTKPITYKTRDGLTINGYLTLPIGIKPQKLPAVVNPHGGPWNRDEWGINPEVQFLANRGYAVLQMDYRGSTGYGKKFYEAGFKQWGKKMQDDITDGVEWLKKEGIADPKRIAIYGSSFGGNATLFGVTSTPDLFAAGIANAAASNMFTFIKSLAPEWGPYIKQFYQMVGDPSNPKDSIMFAEISPIFHVDKIKAPLFISCGANDPRVNRAESDHLVSALKKQGVVVEYMVKDDEGHGFSNQKNQYDFYEAMEKFLDKHVKNKK